MSKKFFVKSPSSARMQARGPCIMLSWHECALLLPQTQQDSKKDVMAKTIALSKCNQNMLPANRPVSKISQGGCQMSFKQSGLCNTLRPEKLVCIAQTSTYTGISLRFTGVPDPAPCRVSELAALLLPPTSV